MPRKHPALWCGVVTAIVVMLLLAFGVADPLELPVRDAALRMLSRRPATATVIVAIDETSLRELGPWPWRREEIARIVRSVKSAGAKAMVLDVLLAEEREGDPALVSALREFPAVMVAAVRDDGDWLLPAPPLRDAVTVAHGNFELDHDGILRRLATTKQSGDRSLTAVCVEAASVLSPINVAVGQAIAPAFRTAPSTIPVVSAVSLLRGNDARILRGRIAFFGPVAQALGDRVLTPVSRRAAVTPDASEQPVPDAGVTVHAAATESLLRGEEVRPLAPLYGGILAGLAVALVVRARRARVRRAWIGLLLVALTLIAAATLLAWNGIAMPVVTLVMTIVLAGAAVEAILAARTLQEGRAAVRRMETDLGIQPGGNEQELGPTLEEIASRLSQRRELDAESKRVLAHELKTPLASMRGLTQLLGSFDLSDAERKRVATLLESEAGKLQTMIQALLDLERLPARDFESAAAVVDLGRLVKDRVEFLQASTGRELAVITSPDILVRADPALLERVVDNLAGNALKYTEGDPIRVIVRKTGNEAVLEVEDRGPGITDAERERIFQRFFRGTTAAGTQGLGLGLSFVAEIARWHRGSVSAAASADGGSVFRVTLPVAHSYARAGGM